MRIKCDNPATRAITLAKFGRERVEFSKNGFAVVPDNIGRYLVRRVPAISAVQPREKPEAKPAVRGKASRAKQAGDSDGS